MKIQDQTPEESTPELPRPQPADRLEQHELRPGETVQVPKPHSFTEESSEIPPNPAPQINLVPTPGKLKPGFKLSEKQQKALGKLKKLRAHKHWHNAKIIIGTVLVFVLIFNSQWFISQFIYLFNQPQANQTQNTTPSTPTPSPQQPTQPDQPSQPVAQPEVVGPQNEIIIPKINIRAPLVFINTINEREILTALRDGVAHYAGTANPGENGNSVFFGHSSNDWWEPGNYKFVFVLLERLAVGDTYEIHYNSRKYVYQITETKIVGPTELSVLNQTSDPTSTLITCTPPGTSWRRFIVFAKQTGPQVSTPSQPAQQPSQNQQQQSGQPTQQTAGNTAKNLPSAPPSIWEQIIIFFQNLFGLNREEPKTEQPQPTQHLPEVN